MIFFKQKEEIKLEAINELLKTVKTVYKELKIIDKNLSELSSNVLLMGNANMVMRREMTTLIKILYEEGILDPNKWDEIEEEVGRRLSELYSKEFKRIKNDKENKYSSERKSP